MKDLENYRLAGNKLDIVVYPHPILKKKARKVELFDNSLKTLAFDMLYTMYNSLGVGLAAPQVAKGLRLFVADVDYEYEIQENSEGEDKTSKQIVFKNFNPRIFINPEIVKKEGETLQKEGCLSFPGIYEKVKRAEKVTVEYDDLSGKKKMSDADGLLSVCIQHEHDHLDGVIFLERMGRLKHRFFMNKYLKNKKKK
ncbi:MAG: peptide deformylase [Halobacteriovoraceae bacterium]|nr:peptide deformylase [Halobacteriovoraceae bacterium]